MSILKNFEPKNSTDLFELKDEFDFFKSLINNDKLPKVILITGNKGIGKATLVNHLMYYFFDKSNYDETQNKLIKKSSFYNQYSSDLFQNIIYLNGSNYRSIKINDIRSLKNTILTTTINDKKRFIILDDVDLFNINSLNGLLKIIEEPSYNNFFILINNNSKPLLETIKSRCLEIKIILDVKRKNSIIDKLIKRFNDEIILDKDLVTVSPGNYIKFNHILNKNKIDINERYLKNLNTILNIYKKEKDPIYKDLMIYFSEYYLQKIRLEKNYRADILLEKRSFLMKKINDFFLYNLSQSTLLNSLEGKFTNE